MGKFKMKGPSLYPKLKLNRGGYSARDDGRPKSSAFQYKDEKKTKIVDKKKEDFTYEEILSEKKARGEELKYDEEKVLRKYKRRKDAAKKRGE